MISRASLALVLLLAGAASLPSSFATAANSSDLAKAQQAKAAQAKAAQAKKAQLAKQKQLAKQQQLQKQQLLAKQQQEQKKDEWYAKDRDHGLDVASKYAPDTIAKLRKNNTIAKGDTVSTGDGKQGWRHYLDRYYSR